MTPLHSERLVEQVKLMGAKTQWSQDIPVGGDKVKDTTILKVSTHEDTVILKVKQLVCTRETGEHLSSVTSRNSSLVLLRSGSLGQHRARISLLTEMVCILYQERGADPSCLH